MKKHTIKWRIFKYNLLVIILLISMVAIIFNFSVRLFLENDILRQLEKIASHTEDIALQKGPDFLPQNKHNPPPSIEDGDEDLGFYFMLDRSLREPLSVLNADYILLDENQNIINLSPKSYADSYDEFSNKIMNEIGLSDLKDSEAYVDFRIDNNEYMAIIKSVSDKNTFGLGWIVIYSSIQKVNQLQLWINMILLMILIFSSLTIVVFSSIVAKKISKPFSLLSKHIRGIAERDFGTKIETPVDDELKEFVYTVNLMSEKLNIYDQAQKTFLQNVSHEFRTPLMSIQSYAEGVLYNVIDPKIAYNIIVDETKRMTVLVEDLLYLSRLDNIEENYRFSNICINALLHNCYDRLNGIAINKNIALHLEYLEDDLLHFYADEEKIGRAITNVVSNCIRHATKTVYINVKLTKNNRLEIRIYDDGEGIEIQEIPFIFERFFKGEKGNYGLGLAISKTVLLRHEGNITAENTKNGALFIIELPIASQT